MRHVRHVIVCPECASIRRHITIQSFSGIVSFLVKGLQLTTVMHVCMHVKATASDTVASQHPRDLAYSKNSSPSRCKSTLNSGEALVANLAHWLPRKLLLTRNMEKAYADLTRYLREGLPKVGTTVSLGSWYK